MKKIIALALIACTTLLGVTGCSTGTPSKTEPITDAAQIDTMRTQIIDAMSYYFDITPPEDVTFISEAVKNYVATPDSPKEPVYFNNIFQARVDGDPIEGKMSGYGGVFNKENTEVIGLIYNIEDTKTEAQKLTDEELQTIAVDFLKEKQLITEDATITTQVVNKDASSKYVSVVNFEIGEMLFAVGVNLQTSRVVYFEHVPLASISPQA